MKPYKRTVQYYETDMMGITHHANYIHWMEEARVDFMEQMGFPYSRMEAEGVVSPVVELSCKYKKPCTFGDEITIGVSVESFSGAKMTICYDMQNKNGQEVCFARSEHTFLTRNGRIARIKRDMPEFCRAIERSMSNDFGAQTERDE
ncbi:MAG: acyl-CoA thioesterase [Clostridia bacterium]|nr:acyl-CoA thioesterase [Clostridia bacterium]